ERTAGRIWGCAESGDDRSHPHGHNRGGVQHSLPHGFVAAVGCLAGSVAAAATGSRDRSGELPAPLSRPEDQASASLYYSLHAQQVGFPSAEGESRFWHADRADG